LSVGDVRLEDCVGDVRDDLDSGDDDWPCADGPGPGTDVDRFTMDIADDAPRAEEIATMQGEIGAGIEGRQQQCLRAEQFRPGSADPLDRPGDGRILDARKGESIRQVDGPNWLNRSDL